MHELLQKIMYDSELVIVPVPALENYSRGCFLNHKIKLPSDIIAIVRRTYMYCYNMRSASSNKKVFWDYFQYNL